MSAERGGARGCHRYALPYGLPSAGDLRYATIPARSVWHPARHIEGRNFPKGCVFPESLRSMRPALRAHQTPFLEVCFIAEDGIKSRLPNVREAVRDIKSRLPNAREAVRHIKSRLPNAQDLILSVQDRLTNALKPVRFPRNSHLRDKRDKKGRKGLSALR